MWRRYYGFCFFFLLNEITKKYQNSVFNLRLSVLRLMWKIIFLKNLNNDSIRLQCQLLRTHTLSVCILNFGQNLRLLLSGLKLFSWCNLLRFGLQISRLELISFSAMHPKNSLNGLLCSLLYANLTVFFFFLAPFSYRAWHYKNMMCLEGGA